MRVFLSGTSFKLSYGGPAVSVAGLAVALAEAGAEVGLWAADGSGKDLGDSLVSGGVLCLGGTAAEAFRAFGAADILHDNGLWMPHNHALVGLARSSNTLRVVSPRGMLVPWALRHKRWKKRVAWHLYQRRDLVLSQGLHATAPDEAIVLGRLFPGKSVSTIPNGVVLPPSAGEARGRGAPDGGRRVALFLGRISPVKGLPMLVNAWARVRPEGWELQIAGPDEAGHLAAVVRAIRKAGVEDCVRFLGPISPDARTSVYRAADLFILPSYSESFGMAVAEALAHELPVLTTFGSPWPALEEKDCGWRVSPTEEGVAHGLRLATSLDKHALDAMGRRGRALVEADFGWSAVARAMMEWYRAVASSRRDSGIWPAPTEAAAL